MKDAKGFSPHSILPSDQAYSSWRMYLCKSRTIPVLQFLMGPQPIAAAPAPATAKVAQAVTMAPYWAAIKGAPTRPDPIDTRLIRALSPSLKGPRFESPFPSAPAAKKPAAPCDTKPSPKGVRASEPRPAARAILPTRLHCFAFIPISVEGSVGAAGALSWVEVVSEAS